MTTPILAVEKLYTDVVALFTSEAGHVSMLATANVAGTVADPVTASAAISGTPAAAAEVRVVFTTGGVVGVDGIVYKVSTDDGVTYGSLTPLGTAATIVVLGVTLTLSGAIALNDFVRWVQTSPVLPKFAFGSREPAKRDELPRIVFVPGDAGKAGSFGPSVKPGRNPRPLMTFNELVTLVVEGFDSSTGAAESEIAQWKATRLLFDALMRAVYKSAHGTYEDGEPEWIGDRKTRRHGMALRHVIAVQSMVPDAPLSLAPANTSAETSTTAVVDGVHDQTDTETTSAEDT
jgi:hypothetical protein